METRLYKCWVKICVFLRYQKLAEILSLLSTELQFLYTRVDSIVGICWVINMCDHKLIFYLYLFNYFEKHYLTFLCKINMFMAILIFCFSSIWSQLLCTYQVANKLKIIFGLYFALISHVCTLYWRLCNYTTNSTQSVYMLIDLQSYKCSSEDAWSWADYSAPHEHTMSILLTHLFTLLGL